LTRIQNESLDVLRESVSKRLSDYRFKHTLGVEKMAILLGEACLPDKIAELRAAALLHDIAKELDSDETLMAIEADCFSLTKEDRLSGAILHSFAAPYLIKRDYPQFATADVLSACRNHTVGKPYMSIFDQIIFISDFIEEGRLYESSKTVRDMILPSLKIGDVKKNCEVLFRAVYESLKLTESHLRSTGRFLNSRMLQTKKSFSGKQFTF